MKAVTIDIEGAKGHHSCNGVELKSLNIDYGKNGKDTHLTRGKRRNFQTDVPDIDEHKAMRPTMRSIDLCAVDMKNGYVDEVISDYSNKKSTRTPLVSYEKHVMQREKLEAKHMTLRERKLSKIKASLEKKVNKPVKAPQYRVTSSIKANQNQKGCLNKLQSCCGWNANSKTFNYETVIGENPGKVCGILDPNRALLEYLSWSFRTSFSILFLSLCTGFFCLIIFFSLLMMIIGNYTPTCFQPNFNAADTPFADAFALSWTTFTTVGFGHTFPSLGVDEPDQSKCFWLHIFCTFESFVGVIFAGCCGAIIFGKVVRIRSLAPIFFSDPVTIRYGSGVSKNVDPSQSNRLPCPILTFRLVNLHNSRAGGELVDAQISVLGIINESSRDDESDENDAQDHEKEKKRQRPSLKSRFFGSKMGVIINEDPESMVNSQSRYVKLTVDTKENPYFKRTWSVNHVLNENSPLVIHQVRKRISENKGFWPEELNDYQSVRESIRFNQIFVSLSGISIASADSVYAQHMYDFADVNIGYKFVPVLFRDRHGKLRIDTEFINDVVEQIGGGGEPIKETIVGTDCDACV